MLFTYIIKDKNTKILNITFPQVAIVSKFLVKECCEFFYVVYIRSSYFSKSSFGGMIVKYHPRQIVYLVGKKHNIVCTVIADAFAFWNQSS